MNILLATYPFGEAGKRPLQLLQETGWSLTPNPYRRRLKAGDVLEYLSGMDAVIAGTEPYDAETLAHADKLKVVSRVGIGLDSVDLDYCAQRGIRVTYTPDAPSDAVAELTVANILNLARHIHQSDRSVRELAWNRLMGRLLREMSIGVLGAGRIGGRVLKLLQPFGPRLLACDIDPTVHGKGPPNVEWLGIDELLAEADLLTVHIPLSPTNRHFINRERIGRMKTGALLINTSRGPILDEQAVCDALLQRHLGGAALDVFEHEPYDGPMTRMENVILTAHIGASAREARYKMELGAAEDCIRVLRGEEPLRDAIRDSL